MKITLNNHWREWRSQSAPNFYLVVFGVMVLGVRYGRLSEASFLIVEVLNISVNAVFGKNP